MMEQRYLLVEQRDGVATVTFHRPEALNALNSQVLEQLDAVIDRLAADPETRVVVFTGEGKAFIAGADLKEMDGSTGAEILCYARRGAAVFRKVETLPKPTIAAVNGYAFGGGFEFVLCTDIRIAGDRAKFCLPEVTLGIVPGFNGTQRLPKCIGMHRAKELIFTGRPVTAAEAMELGVLNRVVDQARLMDAVYETARLMADNSASAIALAKTAMDAGAEADIDVGRGIELGCMAASFGTPDQLEGFRAFKEKRPPDFRR